MLDSEQHLSSQYGHYLPPFVYVLCSENSKLVKLAKQSTRKDGKIRLVFWDGDRKVLRRWFNQAGYDLLCLPSEHVFTCVGGGKTVASASFDLATPWLGNKIANWLHRGLSSFYDDQGCGLRSEEEEALLHAAKNYNMPRLRNDVVVHRYCRMGYGDFPELREMMIPV